MISNTPLPLLVFATNNPNKLQEAREFIGDRFRLLSLQDIGLAGELPETGTTLEHNARQKADWVVQYFAGDVFAEDSGLMVDALGGEPGVYSARYAGAGANDKTNTALLLERLGQNTKREARFCTVISLYFGGKWYEFHGECHGCIGYMPSGEGGFGYDPVFYPKLGQHYSTRSFAEMSRAEKGTISHRGMAVSALIRFLRNIKEV